MTKTLKLLEFTTDEKKHLKHVLELYALGKIVPEWEINIVTAYTLEEYKDCLKTWPESLQTMKNLQIIINGLGTLFFYPHEYHDEKWIKKFGETPEYFKGLLDKLKMSVPHEDDFYDFMIEAQGKKHE